MNIGVVGLTKRLSFPKKREDVERVVEEVESRHESEEHHHHHHHHGVEDAIVSLQMLVDSLNARMSSLESKMTNQGLEIARLYKVLAHIVEAMMADNEELRRRALGEALRELER